MASEKPPIFWSRQTRLAPEPERFLQFRLEHALLNPRERTLLAWPTVLGAPVQLDAHPQGIPEPRLLSLAARMVKALGVEDPAAAWAEDLAGFPDTAAQARAGWRPHGTWAPFAPLVSLRAGVALLAMTGRPEDERYLLACGVALFNCALFRECQEALEILRRRSDGELQRGLQGLILLACGYYHQQHHHVAGMHSIWMDGASCLESFKGRIETPWGRIAFSDSLALAVRRLAWLEVAPSGPDWARFWETPSPEWGFV